jgi:hypothetical protein
MGTGSTRLSVKIRTGKKGGAYKDKDDQGEPFLIDVFTPINSASYSNERGYCVIGDPGILFRDLLSFLLSNLGNPLLDERRGGS